MKISTGSMVLDSLLEGGYNSQEITMIYGPSASGKTTACFLAAIVMIKKGKKVVFIDTEKGFSIERLKQLSGNDLKAVMDNILLLSIDSFEEQKNKFEGLRDIVDNGNIGLVIVDTIGAHYRRVLKDNVSEVNGELIDQLRILKHIVDDTHSSVLITNQVYDNINEQNKVEAVGGKMVKNFSKVLLELQKLSNGNRKAILTKPKHKESIFEIQENGFFILE